MEQTINDAVAKLLGISSDTLSNDLSSGQTLASVAKSQGVSSDSLITMISSVLSSNAPSGAPTLSADQLTSMATNIANGTMPSPGGSAAGSPNPSAGTASTTQGVNSASALDELAKLLGMSSNALSNGLANGASLSSLVGLQPGAQVDSYL